MLLLPIDWFQFTGDLLREAGAKPFNIIAVTWSFFLALIGKDVFVVRNKDELVAIAAILFIVIWGGVVFFLNYLFLPEMPHLGRSSLLQFFSQSGMLVMFAIVLQSQIYLLRSNVVRLKVVEYLPYVVIFHLLFFAIEFFEILNPSLPGFLVWFRNENGLIDRASGLMSEPSYFSAFAALFAIPLILFGQDRIALNVTLAILLLSSALLVQGKTMFVVFSGQLAYYIYLSNISNAKKKAIKYVLILLASIGFYIYQTTTALDLGQNLSSIMRIGSSLLAWNVISDGYGILGIGIGQFHFYYVDKYFPDFLYLSQEALDQMSGISGGRASTFNFLLRIFLEIGALGGIVFLGLIFMIFKKYKNSHNASTQIGLGFIAGSLGFLLTQDTYCLPSLAFGIALAIVDNNSVFDSKGNV
jgi:hypothetical protein